MLFFVYNFLLFVFGPPISWHVLVTKESGRFSRYKYFGGGLEGRRIALRALSAAQPLSGCLSLSLESRVRQIFAKKRKRRSELLSAGGRTRCPIVANIRKL